MKEALVNLLAPYLPTVMWTAIGCAVLLVFVLVFYILPKVAQLLLSMVGGRLGEKVRLRIADAIAKLNHQCDLVIAKSFVTFKAEMKKALADKKVTPEEIKAMAGVMAKEVLPLIIPDLGTLQKYVVGPKVEEYVTNMLIAKLGPQMDSMAAKLNMDPEKIAEMDKMPVGGSLTFSPFAE